MTNQHIVLFAVVIFAVILVFMLVSNRRETFASGVKGRGFQYLGCRSSEDCASGFTCRGNDKESGSTGLCVKKCKSTADCGNYFTCSGNDALLNKQGSCVKRCIKSDDCLPGFTCDGNDFKTRKVGRCTLASHEGKRYKYQQLGCKSDDDCKFGSICSMNDDSRHGGICARKCYSSEDCGPDFTCRGNDQKKKKAGLCTRKCKSSKECSSGFTCKGNDKESGTLGNCVFDPYES